MCHACRQAPAAYRLIGLIALGTVMKRRRLTGIAFALMALWVWAVSHGMAGSVQPVVEQATTSISSE